MNASTAATATGSQQPDASAPPAGHRLWVRICHWIMAISVITLAFSGFVILMAHPRLYWGEVGNDLVPALLELPINNNHRPEGWQRMVSFDQIGASRISADRLYYDLFNQNGWGRSLHFLAGWFLVLSGAAYTAFALLTGHLRRRLLPAAHELTLRALRQDINAHLKLRPEAGGAGAPYGVMQKCAYVLVALVTLPFMVLSGLSMSPTVTAAYPVLLDLFGGYQASRTLHFFGFTLVVLFLIAHVAMVFLTGVRRQVRAMIMGK